MKRIFALACLASALAVEASALGQGLSPDLNQPDLPQAFQKAEEALRQEDVVFTGNIKARAVMLHMSVRDASWRFYTPENSLFTDQNFVIKENGKEQKIIGFGAEKTSVSWGLVFDASGSMAKWYYNRIGEKQTNLQYAQAILGRFFGGGLKSDEYVLALVRSEPEIKQGEFTQDLAAIQNLVGLEKTDGQTALYSTMLRVLKLMDRANNERKAILVITDGEENNSEYKDKKRLSHLAQEAEVQIFVVIIPGAERQYSASCFDPRTGGSTPLPGGFSDPSEAQRQCNNHLSRPEAVMGRDSRGGEFPAGGDMLPGLGGTGVQLRDIGPRGLRELEEYAKPTGGWVFDTRDMKQVQLAISSAYNQTRFRWFATYQPQGVKSDGKQHKIEVKVRNADKIFPKGLVPEGLEVLCPTERYAPKD